MARRDVTGDIAAALKQGALIRVEFSVSPKAVEQAIRWARSHRYTYLRDDDLAGLMFDAVSDGVAAGEIQVHESEGRVGGVGHD